MKTEAQTAMYISSPPHIAQQHIAAVIGHGYSYSPFYWSIFLFRGSISIGLTCLLLIGHAHAFCIILSRKADCDVGWRC